MSSPSSELDFEVNQARFTGFSDLYDRYRPSPPAVLAELLIRLAACSGPIKVVDLGSGTGLSTRYWADHADEVIGIEPTDDMRQQAAQLGPDSISYQKGFSHATGLPDQWADILTCSQALHWMDPMPTFQEAARILRPGGVFAAYDYDWPPVSGYWELDGLYIQCAKQAVKLELGLGLEQGLVRYEKHSHLERMSQSRVFRAVRELVVHHHDQGNAERFVGLFLSQGYVQTLLKQGLTESELGIDQLRKTAERLLGAEPQPWIWCSRIRTGIV